MAVERLVAAWAAARCRRRRWWRHWRCLRGRREGDGSEGGEATMAVTRAVVVKGVEVMAVARVEAAWAAVRWR